MTERQIWLLRRLQRVCLFIGFGLLFVCTLMTSVGGWMLGEGSLERQIGFALMLGLITIGSGVLLPIVRMCSRMGFKGMARGGALALVFCIAGEFVGEMMVVGGNRTQNVQNAEHQNIVWKQAVDNKKRYEEDLAQERDKKKHQDTYGTPDSYDAPIKAAEERASLEASKRGGKGKEYDKAMDAAAKLRERQAIARERVEKTEPRIAELEAKLAAANAEIKNGKQGNSYIAGQAGSIARIAFWERKPDATAQDDANFGLLVFTCLLMIVATIAFIDFGLEDFSHRPVKSPRNSRIVGAARMARRIWGNLTGDVIEHHTTKDTEATAMLEEIRRNLKAA